MSKVERTPAAASMEPRIPVRRADDASYRVDPGRGWVLFATIMLAIFGALNIAYGIAAVADSRVYVRDVVFVLGSLNAWGWFLIVIGTAQLLAAIGIWRQSEAARWLGIGFAAANMIVQVFVLPAYPVWALMVFFVDVIIVFGLLTYGGRDRHSLAG
jgi:hypothetical protein